MHVSFGRKRRSQSDCIFINTYNKIKVWFIRCQKNLIPQEAFYNYIHSHLPKYKTRSHILWMKPHNFPTVRTQILLIHIFLSYFYPLSQKSLLYLPSLFLLLFSILVLNLEYNSYGRSLSFLHKLFCIPLVHLFLHQNNVDASQILSSQDYLNKSQHVLNHI